MKILEKSNSDSVNSIGKGSVLEGSINAPGDIRIDGVLKGRLIVKGRFILGQDGAVEGEVECGSAVISGELKANIESKEMLILKESARLYGDIKTEKISIEPGAMFSGKCIMGPIHKPKNTTLDNKQNNLNKDKKLNLNEKKEENKKENESKI